VNAVFRLVDGERHCPTVFTRVDVFSTDIYYATAPQTTSLGSKNGNHLIGLHNRAKIVLHYECLSFHTGSQPPHFDKKNLEYLSYFRLNEQHTMKSTT